MELYPDTVIATTIQPLNIKDLTSRSVSHTNLFRLPKTKHNLRSLGFLDNEHSQTDTPYKRLPAILYQNGIQIIVGTAFIKQVNTSIEVAIYENVVNLFDEIAKMKLHEIGILTDGPWTKSVIDAARLATSGVFTPVINFGGFNPTSFNTEFYLPSWFYKDIVTKVLEYPGFQLSGSLLSDDNFARLFIPYSQEKWEYPQVFKDAYSFTATGINGSFPPVGATQKVSGGWTVYNNGAGMFSTAFSQLEVPTLGASGEYLQYEVKVAFTFTSTGNTGDSFKYQLIRWRGGVESVLTEQNFVKGGAPVLNYDAELSAVVNLQDGDRVYLKYVQGIGSSVSTHSNVVFTANHTGKIFENWVFFNYLLPDDDQIKPFDFIKDFFMRFAVIDKLVGDTLVLKTLDEVIADRASAVNWSAKRLAQANINFDYDYGQENYFTYRDNLDNNLGRGSLAIANTALRPEFDMYQSPFENCDYKKVLFVTSAYIPVYGASDTAGVSTFFQQINNASSKAQLQINSFDATDRYEEGDHIFIGATGYNIIAQITSIEFITLNTWDGTKYVTSTMTLITTDADYVGNGIGYLQNVPMFRKDFENAPGLKLLYARDRYTNEQGVLFDSIVRTDYKVGIFVQPNEPKHAGFQFFLDTYYPRVGATLQKLKVVSRTYKLNDTDIMTFDKHKLIFDDGYYLVLKINNYISGKPTEVTLLKVD